MAPSMQMLCRMYRKARVFGPTTRYSVEIVSEGELTVYDSAGSFFDWCTALLTIMRIMVENSIQTATMTNDIIIIYF